MSFGWYIVPFSISNKSTTIFKDESNEKNRIERFTDAKYLYSHVVKLFKENKNKDSVKSYRIDSNLYSDFVFKGKENENEYKNDIYSKAKVQDIVVSDFNSHVGFLCFKISYENMAVNEIIDFTYNFKRLRFDNLSWQYCSDKKSNYNICGLERLVSKILNNKNTKPFFYSNSNTSNCCNILQFIKVNNEIKQDEIFCIGRGVNNNFIKSKDNFSSEVDVFYEPYEYIKWYGCQNVLACIVYEPTRDAVKSQTYISERLPQSIDRDYLCMYTILLNERYSMMYLISRILDYKEERNKASKKKNYEILTEVDNELNYLRINTIFNSISNEMVYQNLYNKMYKIFGIDSLIKDVEESSKILYSKRNEKHEQRSKIINIILACLSFLTIGSALMDFSAYFDRIPLFTFPVHTIASLIIVLLTFMVGILFARSNKNK